jgi:type IV fimbrial biogenesis protein FimT
MEVQTPSKKTGFTLVELMITVAILGIILSLSVPSFQQWIRDSSTLSASSDLYDALQRARSEAIRLGTTVSLRSKSATDGSWEDGWCIAQNTPANCNGTLLSDYQASTGNVSITDSISLQIITFSQNGNILTAAAAFSICNGTGNGEDITLFASGSSFKSSINCP